MATSERLGTASSRPLSSGPQTTRLAVPRRYPVDVGENFPLLSSFYTGVPTELPGRDLRELRPATGPPSGSHPRSLSVILP